MIELQTTDIIYLNTLNIAYLIKDQYSNCFKPMLPNVYTMFSTNPIFDYKKRYFTTFSLEAGVPIEEPFIYSNIEKIKGYVVDENNNVFKQDILDECGNVIIPSRILSKQKIFLRGELIEPLQQIIVIKAGIQNFIESITKFNKFASIAEVSEVLELEYLDFFIEDGFDKYYSFFYTKIENFIGNDSCHVYIVELNNLDIVIHKTIDFRVYDWSKRMESGEWG